MQQALLCPESEKEPRNDGFLCSCVLLLRWRFEDSDTFCGWVFL